MDRELAYRSDQHAWAAEAEQALKDMVGIEETVRRQEQAELVDQLKAEVLASVKGQVGW